MDIDMTFWQTLFWNIFLTIYAMAITISVVLHKHIIDAAKNCFVEMSFRKYIIALSFTCTSILLTPAVIFSIPILWIYKKGISLLLTIKYGKKFGGMLDGVETYACVDSKSNGLVNMLLILDYDGESDDFYNSIKKYIEDKLLLASLKWPELTCVRQKYFGYFFKLKDEYDVDELVQRWNFEGSDEIIDEITLQKSMNSIGSRRLPKNNNVYWEILVGNKPVQWKNNVTKQYPLLINIHHSLGSGSAIMQFINYFFAQPNNNDKCNYEKNKLKRRYIEILTQRILSCVYYSAILFVSIIISPFNFIMKETDENMLYGKVLSGETLLIWKSEDREEYIPKIKEIKKKLPGTTFVHVLLSATASSLYSYVNEGSTENLKICASMAADLKLPRKEEFLNLQDFELTIKHLSAAPVYLLHSFVSAKKIVDLTKERVEILKSSLLIQVNNTVAKVFGVMPAFVAAYFNSMYGSTLVFSNLPLPFPPIFCNEFKLHDHIVWTVNREKIGISLLFMTYENKLKVGLVIDKALISNENDAKKLTDGIFDYVDLLHKEVCF